eukprot:scaffold42586_cov48-Prasinocladus_malaysianus.AAC.1
MFDWSSFSKPADLSEATGRLRTNFAYFRNNYIVLMAITTMLVILMNPSSLIVIASLAASWIYMFAIRTSPVMIGERALSEREKFLGMCAISFVVVFFLTSCLLHPYNERRIGVHGWAASHMGILHRMHFITSVHLISISVASVLFSAVGCGAAVIAAHGALRTPDDLFLDEADQSGTLMSIFTAPPAGQPIAAAV